MWGSEWGSTMYVRLLIILVDLDQLNDNVICLFVYFVALRPKSLAMAMAGRSVNLNTLYPEQA